MPYIDRSRRRQLLMVPGDERPGLLCTNAGELNYMITKLCIDFIGYEKNYSTINEVIGALECAKLEFYRRVVAPYEDTKVTENGDVYPVDLS